MREGRRLNSIRSDLLHLVIFLVVTPIFKGDLSKGFVGTLEREHHHPKLSRKGICMSEGGNKKTPMTLFFSSECLVYSLLTRASKETTSDSLDLAPTVNLDPTSNVDPRLIVNYK